LQDHEDQVDQEPSTRRKRRRRGADDAGANISRIHFVHDSQRSALFNVITQNARYWSVCGSEQKMKKDIEFWPQIQALAESHGLDITPRQLYNFRKSARKVYTEWLREEQRYKERGETAPQLFDFPISKQQAIFYCLQMQGRLPVKSRSNPPAPSVIVTDCEPQGIEVNHLNLSECATPQPLQPQHSTSTETIAVQPVEHTVPNTTTSVSECIALVTFVKFKYFFNLFICPIT